MPKQANIYDFEMMKRGKKTQAPLAKKKQRFETLDIFIYWIYLYYVYYFSKRAIIYA